MSDTFILILMIILYSISNSCSNSNPTKQTKYEEVTKVESKKQEVEIEEVVKEEVEKPVVVPEANMKRVKLIGRLGNGIYKWKTRRENSWVSCGELHEDGKERSVAWAYQIATSAEAFDLNPWHFAGVAANESGFDECSLGRHPRKLAYKKGYLQKNKRFLSYKKKDIVDFYNSPIAQKMFSATGVDVGPWQILSNHWHMRKYEIEEILSMDPGTHIAAGYAAKLRKDWNEPCSFKLWRPAKDWYFPKIKRRAKVLGATDKELRSCKWEY